MKIFPKNPKRFFILIILGSILIVIVTLLMRWFEYKAMYPSGPIDPMVP